MRRHKVASEDVEKRRFHATFGTCPELCSVIWGRLIQYGLLPEQRLSFHLLWALMFMKLYCSESVHCALAGGVDEKTFQKWAWLFVDAISWLEPYVVRLSTGAIKG